MEAYMRNISVEIIGPEEAKYYLSLGTRDDDSYNWGKVRVFANAMRHNDWGWPGGVIELTVEDKLRDGHHRLQAVVQAGVPLPMIVVRNVTIE